MESPVVKKKLPNAGLTNSRVSTRVKRGKSQ